MFPRACGCVGVCGCVCACVCVCIVCARAGLLVEGDELDVCVPVCVCVYTGLLVEGDELEAGGPGLEGVLVGGVEPAAEGVHAHHLPPEESARTCQKRINASDPDAHTSIEVITLSPPLRQQGRHACLWPVGR